MEEQFIPLPEATPEPDSGGASSKTDAEILYDMIDVLNKKADENATKLEEALTKLTYIVNLVEKLSSNAGTPNTPSTSVGGKRRATSSS